MNNITRKITMADPYFCEEDRIRIHKELDNILSGKLSMGPNVQAFEEEFARMVGVRYAIALNSCTSALEIALLGLGVKDGDEVIVPSETFIATGMAVHLVGGKPVFAEVSERDFCLDPEDVICKITPKTKGIILVHMAGTITKNISSIIKICSDNNLFLIEDAAHSPGAFRNGKYAGSIGDAGCFSFFPTKVITAGEGGMLTTNNDHLAEIARSMQHRGRDLSVNIEQYIIPGRNVRMTEINALLGRVQLSHLDEYLAERRRVMSIYREFLSKDDRIKLIIPEEERASSYWKIPVLLSPGVNRVVITNELKKLDINVDWAYQPALHLQPVFQKLYGTQIGSLPKTEDLLSRHICLPCHPGISNEDASFVAESLKMILNNVTEGKYDC